MLETFVHGELHERRGGDYRRAPFFPLEKIAIPGDDKVCTMGASESYQVVVPGVPGVNLGLIRIGYEFRRAFNPVDEQLGNRKINPST